MDGWLKKQGERFDAAVVEAGDAYDNAFDKEREARLKAARQQPVIKEGDVTKKSGIRRNWVPRRLELRGDFLFVFEAGGWNSVKLESAAELATCKDARRSTAPSPKPHEMEIMAVDRTYRIACPSEAVLDEWLAALEPLTEAGGPPPPDDDGLPPPDEPPPPPADDWDGPPPPDDDEPPPPPDDTTSAFLAPVTGAGAVRASRQERGAAKFDWSSGGDDRLDSMSTKADPVLETEAAAYVEAMTGPMDGDATQLYEQLKDGKRLCENPVLCSLPWLRPVCASSSPTSQQHT
jgi:hypothetical protein